MRQQHTYPLLTTSRSWKLVTAFAAIAIIVFVVVALLWIAPLVLHPDNIGR